QGDAAGEAGDHRRRDEVYNPSQVEDPQQEDHRAGQQAGCPNALKPVAGGQNQQDRGHGPGRPGDLVGSPAETADQEAGQDRRDQPGGRGRPGRDAEGQRQGQGDGGDGGSGQQVAPEVGQVVTAKLIPQEASKSGKRE